MILLSIPAICQNNNLAGFYEFSNYATYRNIDLKVDSTFKYRYSTDIYRESRTGNWGINNDTIILYFNKDTTIENRYKLDGTEFIDTSIYKQYINKWLIVDNETFNTHYDTSKINKEFSNFAPAYYYKTKEYNSQGRIVKRMERASYLSWGQHAGDYHGLIYEYFEDGKIKKIIEYQNGIKNGMEIIFHQNNTIANIKEWKKGKLQKKIKKYNKEGKEIKLKK